MSAFQPSTFQVKNEGCDLNYEQLLCFKVFKAVRDLKIFEDQFLVELDQFATNHLLFWSKEVMAAYTMCCFDDGDRNHEHAKRVLIYRFKQLFLHCKATNYNDTVPFEIDWKTYLLQKKGISIDSRQDASVTMFDMICITSKILWMIWMRGEIQFILMMLKLVKTLVLHQLLLNTHLMLLSKFWLNL